MIIEHNLLPEARYVRMMHSNSVTRHLNLLATVDKLWVKVKVPGIQDYLKYRDFNDQCQQWVFTSFHPASYGPSIESHWMQRSWCLLVIQIYSIPACCP